MAPSQVVSLAKAMNKKELMTTLGSNIVKQLIASAAGKVIGQIGKDWDDKWSDSKPGWGDTWENHWTGDSAIAINPGDLKGLPTQGLAVEVAKPAKLAAVHVNNLSKHFSADEIGVLKELKLIK